MSVIAGGPVKSIVRTIFRYVIGSCRISLMMGIGDVLVQGYNGVPDPEDIDWQRTAKFATIGLCFVGPALTYWRGISNSFLAQSNSQMSRILKRLLSDQIFLAPSLNLGIISFAGVLNNVTIEEIERHVGDHFPCIIKRHYMLWPAVQFFGSICIQPALQLVLANTFAILWFAYISGILHNDEVLRKAEERDTKSKNFK